MFNFLLVHYKVGFFERTGFMKKLSGFFLIILFLFMVTACSSAEKADSRDSKYKGSVAESRVRDRKKLLALEDGNADSDTDTKEETGSNEKITLKLAEVHAAGYPTTLADQKFAELINQKTEGRITIDVYSDGKLGDENTVIEAMQNGTVDFARVSLSPMTKASPELNALSLPYLYENSEHMWKVLNSDLGQQMLESISKVQLVGLAWYDGGARNFFSNKEIKSLKDIKGLRLRMQNNDLMFGLAKALGAEPKDMPMGDINNAIEQGVLDGAENNIPTYESLGHAAYAPYYILDSHSRIPEILAGSQKTFSGLSEDDQKIIKECAKETQEYEIQQWEKREIEAKEKIKKQGTIFIEPSPEAMEEIRNACEPLYDEFGADYKDIIQKIKDMA